MSEQISIDDMINFCKMSKKLSRLCISANNVDMFTQGFLEGMDATFDGIIQFCEGKKNGGDNE